MLEIASERLGFNFKAHVPRPVGHTARKGKSDFFVREKRERGARDADGPTDRDGPRRGLFSHYFYFYERDMGMPRLSLPSCTV